MATIKNDRDVALQNRGVNARIMNPVVTVAVTSASPTGTPYFTFADNSTTVLTPASITLTATATTPGSYTAPSYAWYYSTQMDPTTWTTIAGVNTAACTITSATFRTQLSTGANVNYKVVVSQAGWSTTSVITSIDGYKNINSPPIVSMSKDTILLPSTGGSIDYSNSSTDIMVSLAGTNIPYDTLGTALPNTFTVSATNVGTPTIALGTASTVTTTVTNDTRRYGVLSAISSSTGSALIVYTITVRDVNGKVYTYTKNQSISVAVQGQAAKNLSITSDSLIFTRDATNAISNPSFIKLTANKQNTTNTVTWSTSPAVTLYTASTGGIATTTGDVVYMRSGDYSTNTYVTITASIAADSLVDTTAIASVKTGSSALQAVLSNYSAPLPTTSGGIVTYTGSGTTIQVYEGATLRTITGVTVTATNITAGAVSGVNGTTVTIADHTAIAANNASIKYALTVTRGDGTSDSSISVTQAVYKSLQGATGNPGTAGDKYITINAYQWATSPPAAVTATPVNYTFAGAAVSAFPTLWSASAGSPTLNGMSLYQLNLTLNTSATGTIAYGDWINATRNTVGYRNDGTIGPTGQSARRAYVVTTTSTVPGAVTAGTGDVPPTNAVPNQFSAWNYTATGTLAAGQYMYQVDGLYTNGGNVTWGNPYLSNLKVGSLSALAADLGTVSISSTGALNTTGKAYGDNVNGIFLGYSGTAYKFQMGSSTAAGMSWDGATFTLRNTSGTTLLSAGSVPQDFLNSAVTISGRNVITKASIVAGGATITAGYDGLNNAFQVALGAGINYRIQNWTIHDIGDYSISFWIKTSVATNVTVDLCDTNPNTIAATTAWQYVKYEALNVNSTYLNNTYFGFLDFNPTAACTLYVSNLMLEFSNKASSWTPAPEDTQNANITISSGAISGIGTGSGTIVDNSQIGITGAGTITGVGLNSGAAVANSQIGITGAGAITGVGLNSGAAVANTSIIITGGSITGIGTGTNTIVANSAITVNSGVLTGIGTSGVTVDNKLVQAASDFPTANGMNPLFKGWGGVGTYPPSWTFWSGSAPIANAQERNNSPMPRWSTGGANCGIYQALTFPSTPHPAGTFMAGAFDILYNTYTSGGSSGILVRLYTNAGLTTYIDNIFAATNHITGVWQRIPFTARAGTNLIYGIYIYVMPSWSGMPGGLTTCDVTFGGMTYDFYTADTDPASIKINADGSLTGGGGGQVSIAGLGFVGDLDATNGKSLARPFASWNLGTQTLQTVADGKVGTQVLRLTGGAGYPNMGKFVPIDRTKTYRTRFWARPSATNTAGLLYFSLQQFLNNTGTTAATNGGRAPYKPSGVSPATHNATFGAQAWGEYSYTWSNADWQADVTHVRPDFLDNYPGAAGYWEIQDFTFEEITEVTAAATAVTTKLNKAAADILTGPISLNSPTAILVGTSTDGVYLGNTGLVGKVAGQTTFAIGTDGNAVFSGTLSGASGSFQGNLTGASITGATGTFTGVVSAASINLASSVGVTTTLGTAGLFPVVVPAGLTRVRVTAWGGGGGGAGGASRPYYLYSGSGGSSGGFATGLFTVTGGSTLSVRVGAGGGSGAAFDPGANNPAPGYAYGSTGGASEVVGYLLAPGGPGGLPGTNTNNAPAATTGGVAGLSRYIAVASKGGPTGWSGQGGNGNGNIGVGGTGGYGDTNTVATNGGAGAGGGGGGTNMNNNALGMTGGSGGPGRVTLEFYDPNGVILKSSFDLLKSELRAQGHTLT